MEQWSGAALAQQAVGALTCHTQGATPWVCFTPSTQKWGFTASNIYGSVSTGLVAVAQRQKFTTPVVLGPQKCYFLLHHLSPESPCKGPHHTGKQAEPTAEHCPCPLASSEPRTCECCSNAALEMFSPELYWFYFSYPSLQIQASPDKLQCRKQIQAVVPEDTGPVKTFSDPTEALPCLAEPSTGADAEAQPRPAVSDTTGAASSVLSTKIINTNPLQNCLILWFGSLVLPLPPWAEVASVRFGSLPHC